MFVHIYRIIVHNVKTITRLPAVFLAHNKDTSCLVGYNFGVY